MLLRLVMAVLVVALGAGGGASLSASAAEAANARAADRTPAATAALPAASVPAPPLTAPAADAARAAPAMPAAPAASAAGAAAPPPVPPATYAVPAPPPAAPARATPGVTAPAVAARAPLPGPAGAPERAPASVAGRAPAPVRIVLALPGADTPYATAAAALRDGFRAGHAVDAGGVELIEVPIDESPAQWAGAVVRASERGAALIVGALTRGLAQAVGGGAPLPLPAVLLNLPDSDAALPPGSLVYGLSVEQEARFQVAQALRDLPPPAGAAGPSGAAGTSGAAPRFAVLAGGAPLDRRVAQAFVEALRAAGQSVVTLDVPWDDGTARDPAAERAAVAAVGSRVARLPLDAAFLALGAADAAALRPRLPRDVPLYATSQVHAGGAEATLLAHDLEAVRFVDAPWLLEPDHPAVMIYPRSPQPLSAELQRLYALGIDAYRLARASLAGRGGSLSLDGVTGTLRALPARSSRVERTPALAVFRNGRVERGPLP